MNEIITATHPSAIGRNQPVTTGKLIGVLLAKIESHGLLIRSLYFSAEEITAEFYESELAGAALKEDGFTPEISIERWAAHFLSKCIVSAVMGEP